MSQQKVRIGIIGGGGIVRAHLPRLKERSELVDVVAVSDVNPQAAQGTAEEFSIPRFSTDYKEWLDEVDAVVIGVPTHLHASIGIDCANAGKHIFMEKPMTRTMQQTEDLLAAVEKSGVQLQVGFVRRFDTEWMTWRELILENKIGRPVSWRHSTAGYGAPSLWFNQEEQGGGPFIDGCIHNIDFALYTFGPAKWAFLNGRTMREGSTALDTGTATVRFESGDEMMLAWSWGLPMGSSGGGIFDFLGPKGTLMYSSGKGPEWKENHLVLDYGEAKETEQIPFITDLGAAFGDQMDEFIAVARGETLPRAGGKEGLESMKLALAVLESGRTGEVVHL